LLAASMAADLGAKMVPGRTVRDAEAKAMPEQWKRDHWKSIMTVAGNPQAAGAFDECRRWLKGLLRRNRAVLDALASALASEGEIYALQARTVAAAAGGVAYDPLPRWAHRLPLN